MKLHNLVLLFVVLILVFEQTTRIEARRRSLNVQRNDKKLIRAGDFRLLKPKMNKRELLSFCSENFVARRHPITRPFQKSNRNNLAS